MSILYSVTETSSYTDGFFWADRRLGLFSVWTEETEFRRSKTSDFNELLLEAAVWSVGWGRSVESLD